jgi:hypothetical protein
MKSAFSICRIFSSGFFIMFICSSCTSYMIVNGGEHVPKKVTIYVTGYDTTGHLTLEDVFHHSADPFTAYPGQKIRWKISGVKHFLIDNIVEKSIKAPPNEVFRKNRARYHFFPRAGKELLKMQQVFRESLLWVTAADNSYFIFIKLSGIKPDSIRSTREFGSSYHSGNVKAAISIKLYAQLFISEQYLIVISSKTLICQEFPYWHVRCGKISSEISIYV